MFRIQATDYESERLEKKDYLYYETEWRAKNWKGNDLGPVEHIEGMHKEQTRKLVKGDFHPKTGIQEEHYIMGLPRVVYTIPFSKDKVDEIINNEHPFGPDSINVTDVDKIVYYGKFQNILGLQSFRCADYDYYQFVVKGWKQFVALAIQEGGPQRRIRFPNEELEVMRADMMAQAKQLANQASKQKS